MMQDIKTLGLLIHVLSIPCPLESKLQENKDSVLIIADT